MNIDLVAAAAMLTILLGLAAGARQITEGIVGGIKLQWPAPVGDDVPTAEIVRYKQVIGYATFIISEVVAIVLVAGIGTNFFIILPPSSLLHPGPTVGVIVTGIITGFGSNVWNEIFNVLQAKADTPAKLTAFASVETAAPDPNAPSGSSKGGSADTGGTNASASVSS